MPNGGTVLATSVGQRIKQLRLERGLSQAHLAKAVGVTSSYISVVEGGRRQPRQTLLTAFAAALDVPTEYLVTGNARCDEFEVAVEFGEMMLRNRELAQAQQSFQQVIDGAPASICGPLRRRAQWGLARAYERLGEFPQSLAELEALLAEPNLPPAINRAAVLTELCYVLLKVGDLKQAIARGEAGLDALRGELERLAAAASDPRRPRSAHGPTKDEVIAAKSFAELASTLVECYRARGDLPAARRLNREAIRVAERRGSLPARGAAYWVAAQLASDDGDMHEARRLTERALAIFGEADSDSAVAALKVNAVTFAIEEGHPIDHDEGERLLADLRSALECFQEHGSTVEEAETLRVMAQLLLALDRLADAEAAIGGALQVVPEAAHLEKAQILRVRGDIERARGARSGDVIAAYQEATAALRGAPQLDRASQHSWIAVANWLRTADADAAAADLLSVLLQLAPQNS